MLIVSSDISVFLIDSLINKMLLVSFFCSGSGSSGFKSGLGYSSINTARCALSSYFSLDNSVNISSNVLVKRFMKGVYTLRPALPKYNVTWDVNVVYLKHCLYLL
jgi:hypothetical protein